MIYRIGVNDIEPGHWVAHVFDLYGCFSRAATRDEAVAVAPTAIKEYFAWLKRYEPDVPVPGEPIEVVASEAIRSVALSDGYFANAFFDDDRRILTDDDVARIRRILGYTRADLMNAISRVRPEQMDCPIKGEVTGSIRGVINHVATAEWWYLDRLDLAFPRADIPEDVPDRLKTTREHTLSMLPTLVGLARITEKRGEQWSARKALRRTLWHEIAHTRQIQRYVNRMP